MTDDKSNPNRSAGKPRKSLDDLDWDDLVAIGFGQRVGSDSSGVVAGDPSLRSSNSSDDELGYDELPGPISFMARDLEPKPDFYSSLDTWIKYKLGEDTWSKQKEISVSLKKFRYTAVQSCHGAGKSYIASRAIANWIDSHDAGDAFVVTTAPTSAQVSAILWRETQKAHRKGKLSGNITTAGYPQWKLQGELVGYGRKPAEYTDSAFQGIHAPYILIVIDEASGVSESLFNAVDALATNKNARVLAIGNPDDPTSYFAKVCKPNSGWNVIRIDGLRSPLMTRENISALISDGECLQCSLSNRATSLLEELLNEESIPYSEEAVNQRLTDSLISPLWVEERLHRWVGQPSGEVTISKLASQSALFTAKVRGIFPESNSDGIIPLGWIEAAIARWHDWSDRGRRLDGDPRRVVGADIARFGEDATSIAIRHGDVVTELRGYRFSDTMETTGYIVAALREDTDIAVVDVIGVGAGVVDRLRELGKNNLPFNAAAAAKHGTGKYIKDRSGEFRFANLRAAAWWNLRELLDPSRGSTLCLPDSETLRADLTAPRYTVKSGGIIQVELKEDIRKRLGRSTDEGDSVVQAFWTDSESAEFYSTPGSAVSWWQDLPDPDVEAAVRWVQPDAIENWIAGKEQQVHEEGEYYGGFGPGGYHRPPGLGTW